MYFLGSIHGKTPFIVLARISYLEIGGFMPRLKLEDIFYLYDSLEERIKKGEVPKEIIPLFVKWMGEEDVGKELTSFLTVLLGLPEEERYKLAVEYIERRLRKIERVKQKLL
jgi:hypothetical protein